MKEKKKQERQTPTANVAVSLIKALSPIHSSQPVIFATRHVGTFVHAPSTIYCRLIARRNAFIISESARAAGGQKSARDGILAVEEGRFLRDADPRPSPRQIRIQMSAFRAPTPWPTTKQCSRNSRNNAARYA